MFPISYFQKQSREFGLPWWKLPDVLMIYMAVINIGVMLILYWWFSMKMERNELVVIIVAAGSASITVIGNMVVETAKKVVAVNKIRKEFIDIMSHQMRTPTSITRWYIELLLGSKDNALSPKQLDYIHHIAEANSKLISLVNDLLNLINVEEKLVLNLEKIDLISTIEQVIKSQELFASSKEISVVFEKKRFRKALIKADAIKLKMAIENILNNAIKYSPIKGSVVVSLKQSGHHWEAAIRDKGMGISQGDQPHMFEKFYRTGDKRKLDIQGTGLGLYICKALVEKMSGKIWYQSAEGKGTTFFFRFRKG